MGGSDDEDLRGDSDGAEIGGGGAEEGAVEEPAAKACGAGRRGGGGRAVAAVVDAMMGALVTATTQLVASWAEVATTVPGTGGRGDGQVGTAGGEQRRPTVTERCLASVLSLWRRGG